MKVNKLDAHEALARLQQSAEQLSMDRVVPLTQATNDARLVRRFLNAERQEILILRRYVHLGASKLEEFGVDPSEIMEMRDAAKPKRRK